MYLDILLTQAQKSLLAHGPIFAVAPQKPPYGDYITALELACQNLDSTAAKELRADVYGVLRHPHHLKPNLSRAKTDKDKMILNADKGVALVVMDRQDSIRKAKELLEDTNTYRPIQSDPINKLKTKLVNTLKKIKADTGMNDNMYRRKYLTGTSSPKFDGLPKIHEKDIHLRAIVSSIDSVTYGVAKELARILRSLVSNSIHHVNNTKEFADEIRNTKLEEGE